MVESDNGMKAEYELNTDDVLAYVMHRRRRAPLGRGTKLIKIVLFLDIVVVAIVMALVTAFGDFDKDISLLLSFAGAWLLLTTLWFFLWPTISRPLVRKAIHREYGQKRNQIVGRHIISISPDGGVDKTEMGESSVRWSAVDGVQANDQHLFIEVRASYPYIVPRRAIVEDGIFDRLVEEARRYFELSSQKTGL